MDFSIDSISLSRYVFVTPDSFSSQRELWCDLITGLKIAVPRNLALDLNSLANLPERVRYLLAENFLCSTSEDDIRRGMNFLQTFQTSRKTVHFSINVTNMCNCDCPYCYNLPTEKRYLPTLDSVPSIADFIVDSVNQIGASNLDVCFSGGEPLLFPKFVVRLSKCLEKASAQGNFRYTAELITNGTLLTQETAESLSRSGISSVQITLEGSSHKHDRLRPLRSGQSSYQKIMNAIADASAELDVHIRCHVHRNYDNWISQLLEILLTRDLDHSRITLAPAAIDSTLFSSDEAKKLSLSYPERTKIFPAIWEEIESRGFGPSTILTTTFLCSGNRWYSFALDADGEIYKCMCSGSSKRWNIGHISTGILWDTVDHLVQSMLRSECIECSFLPICAGECPLHLNPSNICPVGLKDFLRVSLEYDYGRRILSKFGKHGVASNAYSV